MKESFDYAVVFRGEVRREPTIEDSRETRRSWFVKLPRKEFEPQIFEPQHEPDAPKTEDISDQTWVFLFVVTAVLGVWALVLADRAGEDGYNQTLVVLGSLCIALGSLLLVRQWRPGGLADATSMAERAQPTSDDEARVRLLRQRRWLVVEALGIMLLVVAHMTSDDPDGADHIRGSAVLAFSCGLSAAATFSSYQRRGARKEQQRQNLLAEHDRRVQPIRQSNVEGHVRIAAWNRHAEAAVRLHNETAVPVLRAELMLDQREAALRRARDRLRADLSIPNSEWDQVVDNPSRFLTVMHALSWGDAEDLLEPRFISGAIPPSWLVDLDVPEVTQTILSPRYAIIQAVVFDGGFARHEMEWNCITEKFSQSSYRRLLWGAVAMVERDFDAQGYRVLSVESTGGSRLEITLAGTGVDYRGRMDDIDRTPGADAFVAELQRRSIVGLS